MRFMNVNYCTEDATVISASNIDSNFPATNLKNPFRSKRIRTAEGTTTLAVVFDLVTSEDVDSIALFWPKEDGIRLSNTATVKIQANASNVWTSPAVDETLTIDNTYMVASHFFTTDQSYRYWRVLIEDEDNAYDYVELGQVWIGKSLDIDPAQNGFKFRLVDRSKVSTTDFGHEYVDEYPDVATLEFSYRFLEYETVQTLENAFRANGRRKPVLVVMDATDDVFDKNHLLVYGKLQPSIALDHVRYDILNIDSLVVTELS